MSMMNSVRAALATSTARQLAVAFAFSLGTLYILAKLLREVSHKLFPSYFPGEPNTALLASPKPNTKDSVTANDLDNATTYDYVIVGTGTAGCVLANRLTEDPNVSVLAIESGHSDLKQLFSRIPAAFGQLFGTPADWNLWTEKDPGCGDRKMFWPRGKMIGGCSSINAMIYNRGAPDDYDEWERLGNSGWGFKNVVNYFNKAEGFTPGHANGGMSIADLNQHGRTGPWKIGYSSIAKLSEMFVDACAAVGIPKIADFNTNKGMIGAAPFQSFIDPNGQRSSTAVAYLTQDVASRSNLKIATGQTVTRIIFENVSGSAPKAIGVEMASSKISPIRYVVKARREVLICAGTIHTPQVLKLSGIGPATELAKFNIPLIRDLPGLGTNLADHIFSTIVHRSKFPSLHYLLSPVKSLPALIEWIRHGTGVMTSNVAEAGAFIRTADMPDAPATLRSNDLTSGPTAADMEILIGPLAYIDHGRHIAPLANDYASIGPIMLRPESRGTVTLRNTDPFEPPIIHANYLSTQHDKDFMVYGMRLSHKITTARPLSDGFDSWYLPKKDVSTMTDNEVLDAVRSSAETLYHPMCTAKMGPREDAMAVVDDRLRVHGVTGLRVIDASVFPTVIACHPCAVVVMVAEKASDLIKEDWQGK